MSAKQSIYLRDFILFLLLNMDGNYISLKITAADLHLKCVLDAEAFAPEFGFCQSSLFMV